MKAICVDDELYAMQYTVRQCQLLPRPVEATGFTRAREALDYLRDHPVDLAILDINMPDMDGIALAIRIKDLYPDTVILFLTAERLELQDNGREFRKNVLGGGDYGLSDRVVFGVFVVGVALVVIEHVVIFPEIIELFLQFLGLARIAFSHGLRNALIPLITVLGPMTVSLMTGSLVVENIFAVPGIGEQFTKSILSNDYYTIMAVTILFSALLVAVIFLTDIRYQIIDPRVRVEGANG